jgi:uncharacterized membrane protein YqjE
MKRLFIIMVVIVWSLTACNLTPITPTATPSQDVTVEPLPTDTPIPPTGVTPLPTETPDATATTTPVIPVTPTSPNNLLSNPGFEGSYRPVIFGEVNVAPDWEPFYCDEPYMAEKCPAPRQGDGNPDDLLMGRPEFKPIDFINYPDRVWEGELAQTWFCFWRTCNAGVWQTFLTVPGEQYEVGAMVESWYNYDDDIPSDLETVDDWAGSVWWIGIDINSDDGIDNAFDAGLVTCEFPVDPNGSASTNHYDNWVHISCKFTAEGTTATVYYGNSRIWPIVNNDNYLDGAYAIQLSGILDDQPTPTPIATPETSEVPVTVEAQGVASDKLVNEESNPVDTKVLLDILFVLLAGGVAFPLGSGLGNLVSAIVDLVKAVLHIFDVELNEEWGGRAFSIATLVVFAVAFYLLGANPLVTDLPDNVEMIVNLSVNVLLAVSGLLGAFNFGDLIHKALKVKAPLWFSIKERAAIKAAQGNG